MQRQYDEARKRELKERRAAGKDLGDAVQRDKLRSAEIRPLEKAADDIARKLVRRVP